MGRYRYRTSVLVGPWRDTCEKAVSDAIRNNQAKADVTGEGIVWLVPGVIEVGLGPEEVPHRA